MVLLVTQLGKSQKPFSHTQVNQASSLVLLPSPHNGVCVTHQRAVVSCTVYLHTKDTIQLTHHQQQPHTALTE